MTEQAERGMPGQDQRFMLGPWVDPEDSRADRAEPVARLIMPDQVVTDLVVAHHPPLLRPIPLGGLMERRADLSVFCPSLEDPVVEGTPEIRPRPGRLAVVVEGR